MMKKALLKFAIVLIICFAIHIFVGLFSSLIVNQFILNTRLANFTIYDGYADFSILLAYIPLSALLMFNKIKGNAIVITLGSFFAFLIVKVFAVDIVAHYFRFYVKTAQNGAYSFEIFINRLVKNWQELLWEFSNLGQALSFIIWVFIALLGICYLSFWAKNKLKGNTNISLVFGLLFLTGLSSCGDNIQREKDKHPEIPEFPRFANNALTYKKLDVATVSYEDYKSAKVNGHNLVIHTKDYFFYAIADSSLFLITGYRKAIKPGMEFPAKNFITLTRLRNNKIEKLTWTATYNEDLPVYNDGQNLTVGRRVFNAKAPHLTFSKIDENDDDLANDSLIAKTWSFSNKLISEDYKPFDSTFVRELDRITIGSDGHLSGGLNNGVNYTYDAVPLIYYEFTVNGKVGKTKINFDEQKAPLLLKVGDNIYCITYSSELRLRRSVNHYEIGVLE